MLPGAVTPFWIPPTLAAALEQSVVAPVFCVTVNCGRFEPVWADAAPRYSLVQVDEVIGVEVNGEALALAVSAAAVLATPGTYFQDAPTTGTRTVYIHLADGSDPNDPSNVVETFLSYRFSDGATDAGGYWWEPRLIDLPALSAVIPADFKGVVRYGSGTLTLANEDRFFQSRVNQNWDAGTTEVKMGVAGLDWADYVLLATFSNYTPEIDDKHFVMAVREPKADTDQDGTPDLYDTTEFPGLRPEDVGRAMQRAYGFVQDVNPVCIDQGGIEFQVAGHAIFSFEAVRVYNQTTQLWDNVDFASTDLGGARFTLDSLTWAIGQQVAVDFYGRKNTDGTLMANPADVAADLLTAAGYAVDVTANNVARDYLRMGTIGAAALPNDLRSVACYIDSAENVLQRVEEIAFNCRCYFTSTATGALCFKPWRTYRISTVPTVTDIDVLAPGLKRTVLPGLNGSKASKIIVNFAQRPSLKAFSVVTAESPLSQFTRAKGEPVPKTYESLCWKQRDALFLAQSMLAEEQFDSVAYSLSLKWRPFLWRPGDHLNFVSDVQDLNVLAEILEVRLNLTSRKVDLKLGNLRGFNNATGFWSDDADVCPNGASMVWAQDDQKNYRRKETGTWQNDKNQATDTPVGSEDWATSRFI